MKDEKLTIMDVARLAKVSITTVSRVINNRRVGKAVKERVAKVIEDNEYCPNSFAQYLGRLNNLKGGTRNG